MTNLSLQNHKSVLWLAIIFTFLILLIISFPFRTAASPANSPRVGSFDTFASPTASVTLSALPNLPSTATSTPFQPDLQQTTTPASLYMPVLSKSVPPTPTPTATLPPDPNPSTALYCNSHAIDIPDNDSSGITSNIQIGDAKYILDLEIRLDISHSWVGDIKATLAHEDNSSQITLVNQPGIPASASGCDQDNIAAILDDDITLPVEERCSANVPSISGIFRPQQPLSTFIGETFNGNWTLKVSDNYEGDAGRLHEWCISAKISDVAATPTPPPSVGSLPSHAQIAKISGQSQALPLDCESRSAVDWAAYFGKKIDEFDFFYSLPESDDPDLGFVGNVYGSWGQIPPYSYGVHAAPIAAALRDYGLEAYAHRPLSWDELRAEIASGRPVIAWIAGNVINGVAVYVVNGVPIYYQPSEGGHTVVARYEHTVIVTGYTTDSVSYLNGGAIYTKSLSQFLESWSALRNMAVTARP